MAGVFDYKRYINIFATAEDVLQVFPRDQRSLTFSFNNLGQDGWICDIDWMTLVVDQIKWKQDNEPDFTNSTVIGYFEGSTSTVVQVGTKIVFPANMYTGPILPGATRNVPITAVNINWYKGNINFQRQFLLIQNWEPGTIIGDPENDPNFIPIVEAYPIFVDWYLSTSTAQVGASVTVTATATATSSTAIMSTVSARLLQPFFPQITTSTLTTTNFLYGEMIGTFTIYTDWIDNVLTPSSTFTITSSTLSTNTYIIVADITRNHNLRLEWLYDKETKYRGGFTAFKTLVATDTRTFVYTGQPLGLSLTQEFANQRSGNSSTFVISHNKTGEGAITGLLTLGGFFTPADGGATQPITLSTGTFNSNGVFTVTQVLATGTYLLQATYAGNLGVDIFKTQYLSTVSNAVTHYVQLGRAFTLTEMLIQEGPNYDYLYAHAIDDGRSEGEIGGLVTFYHNGNSIGTSTFVRHVYEWPSVANPRQTFNLISAGSYPYPYDPYLGSWPNNFPYGRTPSPTNYVQSNPEYPNFNAVFKPNSTTLDWPPTKSKINTLGLKNLSGSGIPQTPFTVEIPNPDYDGSSGSVATFVLTCVEYLGSVNIPAYPAQILNIKPEWSTIGKSFIQFPPPSNNVWTIYTTPQAPLGGGILPRYMNNTVSYGQTRLNGTRYFVSTNVLANTVTDLGDVWPESYGGSPRPSANNIMVFRFQEEIPAPDVVENNVNTAYVYGRKVWQNYSAADNKKYNVIYETLIGRRSINNLSLITNIANNLVYSRSHLATLQLPLGTVPTTGTFTATFAGTLNQGPEGYYPEGIPFQDSAGAQVNLYLSQNPPELIRSTVSTAQQTWGLTVQNFDNKRDIIGQLINTGVPDPSTAWVPRYAYGGWISLGFNLTTNAFSLVTVLSNTRSLTLGQLPSIEVVSTSVAYPNILAPVGRFYPTELSTTYYKRLGWLSRRSPQGTASLICNAATFTNTLKIVDTGTSAVYVAIYTEPGFQTFYMPSESNLPTPLRFDTHPWRSGTGVEDPPYNISSLSIMGVTSATSTSTSTVVMPITLQYQPSKSGISANTGSGGLAKIKLERGITLAFDSNTPVTTARKVDPFYISWNKISSTPGQSGLLELQAPTIQSYQVYNGIVTLPWFQASGDPTFFVRQLKIGSESGPITQYKILTPNRENDQVCYWYLRWRIERWSTDGNTLLATQYRIPIQPSITNFGPISSWEALTPGLITYTHNGTGSGAPKSQTLYSEGGNFASPPPNEPFLYKIFVELVPSGKSGENVRNNITPTNALISRQSVWGWENVYLEFGYATDRFGGETVFYTQNGV